MTPAVKHLYLVFKHFGADHRITVWHQSLYMGIFYLWQTSGMQCPVRISRKKLMALSRIQSIVTYHKCIRQLHDYGYIVYTPSYHPFLQSRVDLLLIK